MYKVTKPLKYLAIFQQMLIPFVSKPTWCVEQVQATNEYPLCGFKTGSIEWDKLGIPSSNIPKLMPKAQAFSDVISFSILLYFTIIRVFLKKATKTAKIRTIFISGVLLYLITLNIQEIFFHGSKSRMQPVLAFFILFFFIRILREQWKQIFMVVFDSMQIMIIIVAYVVFFSLIGFIMFSSSNQRYNSVYFDNIPKSLFNTYVLFTTSNFPDIMLPFWPVSNLTAIYFVGFLLVGLYMLMNLMLAVFYNSFKTRVEAKINKYEKVREEFLQQEFEAAGATKPFKDFLTINEFEAKYGIRVINSSEKVMHLLE